MAHVGVQVARKNVSVSIMTYLVQVTCEKSMSVLLWPNLYYYDKFVTSYLHTNTMYTTTWNTGDEPELISVLHTDCMCTVESSLQFCS